jgi:hypothetical protein
LFKERKIFRSDFVQQEKKIKAKKIVMILFKNENAFKKKNLSPFIFKTVSAPSSLYENKVLFTKLFQASQLESAEGLSFHKLKKHCFKNEWILMR